MTRRHRRVLREDQTVIRREVQQDLHYPVHCEPRPAPVRHLQRRPHPRVPDNLRVGAGAGPGLSQGADEEEHRDSQG